MIRRPPLSSPTTAPFPDTPLFRACGRAAAEVEEQRRAVAGLHQIVAAEHRESRLLGGRDHVERDAGLVPHAPDQLVAIDGAPARLGGGRARQGDVAAHQLVGAHRQRRDRAVYRRVADPRSEEHTSELPSLMRISYAVFCLKKKTNKVMITKNKAT